MLEGARAHAWRTYRRKTVVRRHRAGLIGNALIQRAGAGLRSPQTKLLSFTDS